MPLSTKQRKIAEKGYSACLSCGAKAAQMRAMGRPNEALEERQQATQRIYEEAQGIIQDHDAERRQGGGNGT